MAQVREFLDSFHFEDLKNPQHPSIFTNHPEYDLFILRLPLLEKDELVVESFGFVVTSDATFYYDKHTGSFERFEDKYLGLHAMLDKEVDKLLANIDACDERVAEMEDALYDNTTGRDYIEAWFELKKSIARMERILFKSLSVLKQKVNHYGDTPDFPETPFHDLLEHVDRAHRYSALLLSKLDNIYNFYNTRTSEKINTTVYTLTVISAIFLPLNLLVGFFGMNTSGLPFTGGENGTAQVIEVLIGLVLLMLLYTFLRSHWLRVLRKKFF